MYLSGFVEVDKNSGYDYSRSPSFLKPKLPTSENCTILPEKILRNKLLELLLVLLRNRDIFLAENNTVALDSPDL